MPFASVYPTVDGWEPNLHLPAVDFIADRPAAYLVDSSLTTDVSLRSKLVCDYYQHRFSVVLARIADSPLADRYVPAGTMALFYTNLARPVLC